MPRHGERAENKSAPGAPIPAYPAPGKGVALFRALLESQDGSQGKTEPRHGVPLIVLIAAVEQVGGGDKNFPAFEMPGFMRKGIGQARIEKTDIPQPLAFGKIKKGSARRGKAAAV